MKVRRESVQTRSETGTRRREDLRHTRAVCRRAERQDCPSQPRIRACSRSVMNHAGQETGSNGPTKTILSCGIRTNPLSFPPYGLDSDDPPKRAGMARSPNTRTQLETENALFVYPKTNVRSGRARETDSYGGGSGEETGACGGRTSITLPYLPCLACRHTLE